MLRAGSDPCAAAIERTYLFGVSQTGRMLRDFLANLSENLQGLYAVYTGSAGTADGFGFDDLLAALGSPLAARITQQIQTTIAAVQAIPPPLRRAVVQHPEAVTAAYDAVKELLILLKVDMTNVLGVTVDFGDIDGD